MTADPTTVAEAIAAGFEHGALDAGFSFGPGHRDVLVGSVIQELRKLAGLTDPEMPLMFVPPTIRRPKRMRNRRIVEETEN